MKTEKIKINAFRGKSYSYIVRNYKHIIKRNKNYSVTYSYPVNKKAHLPKELTISTNNFSIQLNGTQINTLKKVLNEN